MVVVVELDVVVDFDLDFDLNFDLDRREVHVEV